ADQTYDKLSSSSDYEKNSRRNQALFAQINTTLGEKLDIQGALRRDFNEQFGTTNTGSLDLAYALTDRWTVTAGHGTAFTAPSFNLLYYPGASNPDLDPEKTRTSRVGATWTDRNWSAGITAFRSRNRDMIASDEPLYVPYNIEKATVRGAEADVAWSHDDWSTSATLTYLSTENEESGERLPRQPRWSGRVNLDRDFGRFSLGTSLHGRSNSEGGEWAEDNEGFVTADLRGAYRINADWRLEARVENIFDRDYQVVHGYNQAPRGVFVSLRYGR
ncbi:MAG: TonB-dependent receptor domain-containing protein, partial [Guyparkeria sp.]|uniref:TonB-dependent receptor domain-containing protein n=1 Tax=Guyparkeria sp. TaxID=2035736 RepID=UPI003978A9BE